LFLIEQLSQLRGGILTHFLQSFADAETSGPRLKQSLPPGPKLVVDLDNRLLLFGGELKCFLDLRNCRKLERRAGTESGP
jgi:hypothetical protein